MKRFFLLFLLLVLFTGTGVAEDAKIFTSEGYEYTILENGTVCVNGYLEGASKLTIPAEIDGKTVTAIGDEAFDWCNDLTAVTIPDSVTAIGDEAFAYCSSLMEITIPDSVRKVGANPFKSTPAAIRVSPEHPYLAVIDGVLFEKEGKRLITYPYESKLSEYAIPQGIRQIGDSAFYWCDSLTAITIPDSVTAIGDEAFSGCDGLTEMTIPDSVTAMGGLTFFMSSNLETVTIPDSVTTIGDRTFAFCNSLTTVTIPDSVTAIGDRAFAFCQSLTDVTFPDSVREVGANPFQGVPAAIRISPEHPYFTVIDGVLFEKESKRLITFPYGSELSEYAIPQGVQQIGDSSFSGCWRLNTVSIPNSVTAIGDEAFGECNSLTTVTIPDSVTSIGEVAFAWCNILKTVTIPDSVTFIGNDAFADCEDLTINVGRGSYAEQYCKDNWLNCQYLDELD